MPYKTSTSSLSRPFNTTHYITTQTKLKTVDEFPFSRPFLKNSFVCNQKREHYILCYSFKEWFAARILISVRKLCCLPQELYCEYSFMWHLTSVVPDGLFNTAFSAPPMSTQISVCCRLHAAGYRVSW